jgi:hypothetical protein
MVLGLWNALGLILLIATIYLSLKTVFGKDRNYE